MVSPRNHPLCITNVYNGLIECNSLVRLFVEIGIAASLIESAALFAILQKS